MTTPIDPHARRWAKFAKFASDMRLKFVKAKVATNPSETLQSDLRQKTVALDERKTAIEQLNSKIHILADKVSDTVKKYGERNPSYLKLSTDLVDLRKIYANRCEKWKQASVQLDRYAEAGLAVVNAGLSEKEFHSKLLAVQDNYNRALASLDVSMLDKPVAAP